MELITSKEELLKAIVVTQSVVERKTTMPILANVLISATENQLRISATDFEITAFVNVRARVQSTGSTTVSARVFGDIVRELPDGEITLKLTGGERLEITAKNSKFKMVGVSAEEFPSLPGIAGEVRGRISSRQLLDMITRTIYAVSQDETRFNLNGVCFEIVSEGKKDTASLRMVATDGHRLAMVTRPVDGLSFEGKVIVPKKGLLELRKVLDAEQDKAVGIEVMEGFFVVDAEDARVSMRLIDGEFPDYNQVIPKKKGTQIRVAGTELAQALKRASLMVTDKGKGVRLDFTPGALAVSSSSSELGEAHDKLELNYEGEAFGIGFNAKYLTDVALSLGEQEVLVMELSGELGAAKFFGENDESYLSVIMPMRLS